MLEPSTLVGFAAMITLTVTANLMLKLGAGVPEAQRIFGLIGWKIGGWARLVRVWRGRLQLPATPTAAQHRPSVCGSAVCRGRHFRQSRAG
jgi:hypothetical protein